VFVFFQIRLTKIDFYLKDTEIIRSLQNYFGLDIQDIYIRGF
jgi:hypothetical protein